MREIEIAQVVAHNPDGRGMLVLLRSTGQMPAISVLFGFHGPADALRVKKPPLPGIGSWGVCLFPRGRVENGVWIATILPSLMDALSTPGTVTDPFTEYDSHFSGYWRQLDGQGQLSTVFPDGSSLTVAAASGIPTVYRHIVDQNGQQQQVAFARSDRIPNPPSPFTVDFVHATGTSVTISPSGNVTVAGGSGTVITFEFGTSSITIGPSGITVNPGAGLPLDLIQGGGSASDQVPLVSLLVSWLAAHTHPTSGGNTGTPNQAITASTIKSTFTNISN